MFWCKYSTFNHAKKIDFNIVFGDTVKHDQGADLTLYLICQFWALPIQPQIAHYKQFLPFPCFQKLPVVNMSRPVSME